MLKVGIVGLPNVGKSTLFNAILKREQALSANYPFATIEPNVGVVDVVDKRLDKLAELVAIENTPRLAASSEPLSKGDLPPIIYANIEFVDIAGLVEGANKGEGLGNQFLANIREVDMIIQVVRDFSDSNIIREHSKNPNDDTEVINNELILKDIDSLEKKIKTIGSNPKMKEELEVLNTYLQHLNKGDFAIDMREKIDIDKWEEYIKPLFLLTDKQMVYVFNVDEDDKRLTSTSLRAPYRMVTGRAERSNLIEQIDEVKYKDRPVVYINAKLESELAALGEQDQKAYLQDLGIEEAGLDKITRLCFSTLGLISYFTAGVQEVRAWEVKKGSNAVEASGRIHTDFMKNFIKAEVIAYEDYIKYGSKVKAREAGKLRLEGKEYIVKDGDVIEFRIGA